MHHFHLLRTRSLHSLHSLHSLAQTNRNRDAFLASLCSFALPRNFNRSDENVIELANQLVSSAGKGAGSGGSGVGGGDGGHEGGRGRRLLSSKNIQALKALFNIAHCLGGMLQGSWLQVLDTFERLDTIILLSGELQHRLNRDPWLAPLVHALLPNQGELAIMAAALARLFESSKYLDDSSIAHLLSALGTLSLQSLAHAATADSSDDLQARITQAVGGMDAVGGQDGGVRSLGGGGVGGGGSSGGSSSGNSSVAYARPPPRVRMFALSNLIATIEHNMFRVASAKVNCYSHRNPCTTTTTSSAVTICTAFVCLPLVWT